VKSIRLSKTMILTGMVFLAALMVESRLAPYGLNLSDEGLAVEGAHQYLRGEYRPDVFAHYSSRYMVEGLLLRVCGDRLTTLRLFWAVLRALTAAMLFWLVTALAGSGIAFPMALLYLVAPGPWHKSWLGFLTLSVALLFLVFRRRPRQSTALLLGAGVGLAFAIHPYTGIPAGLACLLTLPRAVKMDRRFWQAPLFLLLGAAAVALALGGWMRQIGAWSDVLARHWAVLRGDFIGLHEFFLTLVAGRYADLLFASVFDVMLLLGAAALYLSFRPPAWLTPGGVADLRFLALLALFSLPKVLARHDLSHLLQNLPPFLVLAGVLLGWTLRRTKKTALRLAAGLLAGWLVVFGLWIMPKGDYYVGGPGLAGERPAKLANDFAPVFVKPAEKEIIETAVARLRELAPAADDPIFVAPFAPMFYALAGRPNVVPLALFDRPENLHGYSETQILNDLLTRPPRAVLLEKVVTDGKPRNRLENVLPNVIVWIGNHCEKRYSPGGAFIIYACE